MMKNIIAFDAGKANDEAHVNYYDTNIILRSLDTNEVIFKGKNKVVLAGGDAVARKMFDISESDIDVIPTYNDELGIDDPGTEDADATYTTSATKNDPKILLFAIGTDGCGTGSSQIYQVDYNSRIAPADIVPMRYPMVDSDLDSATQEEYAGRKVEGDYIAYYFKKFSTDPVLVRQYSDGTPIESTVYETGMEVDCYTEITLTITKDDMREYFIATTGIDDCRLSSLSLCTAYPRKVDGVDYYMDIRPFTKLNIPTEYMIDVTKGIVVTYQIYF